MTYSRTQKVSEAKNIPEIGSYQELLSADDFAAAFRVSVATIHALEEGRMIFSVRASNPNQNRKFPGFQCWQEFHSDDEFSIKVIQPFEGNGANIYNFMLGQNPDLGNLTPLEAWIGSITVKRELLAEAVDFLDCERPIRLAAVSTAVENTLAIWAAC